jgi:hypothetical protein
LPFVRRTVDQATWWRLATPGLATGPHPHYALKRNGINVNPVTVHRAMPPGEPYPVRGFAAICRDMTAPFGFATPDTVVASDVSDLPAASR